jgi:hypothetical protein
MLVSLGKERCSSWEEMQAWAQNLGHDSLTTTFGSYGKVDPHTQGRLMQRLGRCASAEGDVIDRLIAMIEAMRSASPANSEGNSASQPKQSDSGAK